MSEAKVTSKGQITIPIEIRRALNADTGDILSFIVQEEGVFMKKKNSPMSIQERFSGYNLKTVQHEMDELDIGKNIGEEQ
ncbi:AbrB/MazE/SpoVT family DNA-binding domain-containing protein [Domibacillus aminovorans]|uniref:SpoVT-AbrB domain-containing protein n=1 Tax=Domibacillus aminovorans TaxID=29332 RepID=A0A177LBY4_9BACI|nr:AbrB/MazE/SpoVT family DNA-binding domain-containing protein [Domibacillus aminovorans]OAH63179.1 hypothetical protein AWH49_06390 [Domibacillus aminovorans]